MQIWALPPFYRAGYHQLASPRLLEASTRRYAPSCAFVTPQELCCTKRPVRFCGDSQGSILVNCHNRFNCRGNILPSSLHAPTVCIDSTNINIASSREPWAIASSTKKDLDFVPPSLLSCLLHVNLLLLSATIYIYMAVDLAVLCLCVVFT